MLNINTNYAWHILSGRRPQAACVFQKVHRGQLSVCFSTVIYPFPGFVVLLFWKIAETNFKLFFLGETPSLKFFRYERRRTKKCFLGSQTQEHISRCLARGSGCCRRAGRCWVPCESPSPFARRGRMQQAPAPCLRPPRCSQSISGCSGHSLLMIEMFDWAKFPARMLHDSILSKALAAAYRRSAFTYSALQSFTFPFLDLFQRTTKERVFSNGVPLRYCRVAAQSYSGAVYCLI